MGGVLVRNVYKYQVSYNSLYTYVCAHIYTYVCAAELFVGALIVCVHVYSVIVGSIGHHCGVYITGCVPV